VSFSTMVLEAKTRIIRKKTGERTETIVIPAILAADSQYPLNSDGERKTMPVHIEIKDNKLLVTKLE
jgi:hypothetical protein